MGDTDEPYRPSMRTTALEAVLARELRCTKLSSTRRICLWRTPEGNGFTAPNPDTVPVVPIKTLQELRAKIAALDSD